MSIKNTTNVNDAKKTAKAALIAALAILLSLAMVLLASCSGAGSGDNSSGSGESASNETEEPAKESDDSEEGEKSGSGSAKGSGKALVVYFSFVGNADLEDDVDASSSASIIKGSDGKIKGNAGQMADYIAEETGAKTWEITVKDKYPGDYDETVSQAKEEQEKDVRPELEGEIKDFDSYETFYLAYPNWWYDLPMALYSFFDKYDFDGKTINVFATHGGSGFSDTIDTIKELEPKATVNEAVEAYASDVPDSKEDIAKWIKDNA